MSETYFNSSSLELQPYFQDFTEFQQAILQLPYKYRPTVIRGYFTNSPVFAGTSRGGTIYALEQDVQTGQYRYNRRHQCESEPYHSEPIINTPTPLTDTEVLYYVRYLPLSYNLFPELRNSNSLQLITELV
jgi:hypothetical protein